MGEVYKAVDTRLNRTVAVKVLPTHYSESAEFRRRFEREAQTIAALNHPHICTLYDVGRQGNTDFLVMEYLEGETLAQRIARSPLPLDEALQVAVAIADALDKAHGQGVTHRDLKPGNVMLTESGAKLLDFGLAKLKQDPQSSRSPSTNPPNSDTTVPGTIMGTMQYMAPEQLEGKEADARADLFAFGAILYEMVTGKKAFEKRSQTLLIAAIVSADPEPVSKIQPTAPPALDYIVKRCLVKDPEQRLQTAFDLLCQLRWIAEGGAKTGIPAPHAAMLRRRGRAARLLLAVAALLVAVFAVPAFLYLRGDQPSEDTRFFVSVPDMSVPEAVSISPDGRWIAYSARDGGSSLVFVRPLGSEVPQKLAGTEGAGRLFWSPDSRTIAFFAGGKLKKVEASDGPPQNICETQDLLGGTWNSDGVILFASSKGLQRVQAVGGEPVPVAAQRGAESREPYFLPDGRHYLYVNGSAQAGSAIYAGSLDSTETTRLVAAQSNAIYAEPGYIFYHREGTLYAHPFNAKKLALTGEAIRIADKIPYGATGAGAFAASHNGVLVYRNNPQGAPTPGGGSNTSNIPSMPLLWLDRSGAKVAQAAAPASWAGPSLSPDGKRAAIHRHDPDGGDVWIFEAGQDTPSKFTFDASQDNSMPVWSPDGTRIAFGSRRNGKWGIYLKLADNTHNEELQFESDSLVMPMSWSPDGRLLVYWSSDAKTSGDVWALPLTGEKKPFAILQSPADERHPQVSPDGKWIAYTSNETGRSEIYIKAFPEGPAKIQVSVNGGLFPRWRRDGKELYFLNPISASAMLASDIRVTGSSIQREVPHLLFQSGFVNGPHAGGSYFAYDVSANGQRFLMAELENIIAGIRGRAGGPGTTTAATILATISADRHAGLAPSAAVPIAVVLNWTSLLKK
jgi:Tol biopolymer transport system component/predicted Ser/Thr protein kinase